MKGVVLCLAADRFPLAGSTNTNERPGSQGTGTGGLYRRQTQCQAKGAGKTRGLAGAGGL